MFKQTWVYRFHYRNPKLRLDIQSHQTISLVNNLKISLNTQIDKLVLRSVLKTTILASFLSKSLSYTVINSYLQNLLTKILAKITNSAGTDVALQTSVNYLRALTMCSTFTTGCRYYKSFIKGIGKCIVQKQCFRVHCACTKRFFNLSK